MSEPPSTQERPVTRRDPSAPLTDVHKGLIKILAARAVKDYLAELAEEDLS